MDFMCLFYHLLNLGAVFGYVTFRVRCLCINFVERFNFNDTEDVAFYDCLLISSLIAWLAECSLIIG